MAALPDKASFTDTGVSKGNFRAALDQLNDYLAGLLDTSGTAVAARAKLGLGSAAQASIGADPEQLPTNDMLASDLAATVRKDVMAEQELSGPLSVKGEIHAGAQRDQRVWHAGNLRLTYDAVTKTLDITTS